MSGDGANPVDWLFRTPQFLKGIGPKRIKNLEQQGVTDIYDLFHNLPRGYRDYRAVLPLAQAHPGVEASFRVEVTKAPAKVGRRRFWRGTVRDASGSAELYWFSNFLPGPAKDLKVGDTLWIVGKADRRGRSLGFAHPKLFRGLDRMEVEPVYRGLPWLSAGMRRAVRAAADQLRAADPMPKPFRERWGLVDWGTAFAEIHAPSGDVDDDALLAVFARRSPGYRRLAADMFLVYFLGMGLRRRALRDTPATPVAVDRARIDELVDALPFALTGDQERTLKSILGDMERNSPMFRMVQGDVGSGKTVVALVAAAATAMAGGQAALLAPTEILAGQHARFFDEILGGMGLRIGRLTGSVAAARRKELKWQLQQGALDIVIGTHALLQEDVDFRDLRLVVIDEEQRYGVAQRGKLRSKGAAPHSLLLSATPIPRSLTLSLLGETDVSVIRQKPAGRAPVATELVLPDEKRRVLEHIRRELDHGHKVFFLYPRVDAEGEGDQRSVLEMHERLSEFFGADRVGLLHGRMPGEEKDRTMRALRTGEIQILVSTSVIEVGVDVPDATVLVIGHPETFGLSQLHQIRGRIGRGSLPGTCYLLVDDELPEETQERLTVLARTNDGFAIAEADLELRGAGSVVGTRQSGLPDLNPVLLNRFRDLAAAVRTGAAELLDADPQLLDPKHRGLREILLAKWDFPVDGAAG